MTLGSNTLAENMPNTSSVSSLLITKLPVIGQELATSGFTCAGITPLTRSICSCLAMSRRTLQYSNTIIQNRKSNHSHIHPSNMATKSNMPSHLPLPLPVTRKTRNSSNRYVENFSILDMPLTVPSCTHQCHCSPILQTYQRHPGPDLTTPQLSSHPRRCCAQLNSKEHEPSGTSYLSESGARSCAGGHFFLSLDEAIPRNCGAILNIAYIIKHVMSSATEAELAA